MKMKNVTLTCPYCGFTRTMEITDKEYKAYFKEGKLVQEAMPDRDPFFREQMINGACPDCISRIMHIPKPGDDWGNLVCRCDVCDAPIYEKDRGVCCTCGWHVKEGEQEE